MKQINDLQPRYDKAKGMEDCATSSNYFQRKQKVARLVLIENWTIREASEKVGIHENSGRCILHQYCKQMNPEAYNRYGPSYYGAMQPSLEWLREHAGEFVKE